LDLDVIKIMLGPQASGASCEVDPPLIRGEVGNWELVDDSYRWPTKRNQDDRDIRVTPAGPHDDPGMNPLASGQVQGRPGIELLYQLPIKMERNVIVVDFKGRIRSENIKTNTYGASKVRLYYSIRQSPGRQPGYYWRCWGSAGGQSLQLLNPILPS
jgi:hypothetical protein